MEKDIFSVESMKAAAERILYLQKLLEWSSGESLDEVETKYEKFKEEFPEMIS